MSTPERRAQDLLEQVSGTGIPVAQLLCDRHDPQAVAFTVVEQDLSRRDLTYGHLTERSQRAAAALAELGVGPGDRVATLMGKGEDLVVTLLGIWRLGAIHIPLFTAFAPSAIAQRLLPSQPGRTHQLGSAPVTMGRSSECDIPLEDDYASGRHARLFPQGSRWFLEDLGSTNGTYIDEQRLTRAVPVDPGRPFRVGKSVLELRS